MARASAAWADCLRARRMRHLDCRCRAAEEARALPPPPPAALACRAQAGVAEGRARAAATSGARVEVVHRLTCGALAAAFILGTAVARRAVRCRLCESAATAIPSAADSTHTEREVGDQRRAARIEARGADGRAEQHLVEARWLRTAPRAASSAASKAVDREQPGRGSSSPEPRPLRATTASAASGSDGALGIEGGNGPPPWSVSSCDGRIDHVEHRAAEAFNGCNLIILLSQRRDDGGTHV